MNQEILLVGAGNMAMEYAKVLNAFNIPFIAVGRSQKSAEKFHTITGHVAVTGGISNWLNRNKAPQKAIVAVDERESAKISLDLLAHGVKTLLLEKPGGISENEIRNVSESALKKKAAVYIAYNRRYYSSVEAARKIIKSDGGVLSFFFEFTEWGHQIAKSQLDPKVTQQWLLANSSHVIDLAFCLAGKPTRISAFVDGSVPWHTRSSRFSGSGISSTGALFSYYANWESPGRWSLEINTRKHRLIFRPLEKLQIQKIGELTSSEVELKDDLDKKFKPGLYNQVLSFMKKPKSLLSITEHLENIRFYKIIEMGGRI